MPAVHIPPGGNGHSASTSKLRLRSNDKEGEGRSARLRTVALWIVLSVALAVCVSNSFYSLRLMAVSNPFSASFSPKNEELNGNPDANNGLGPSKSGSERLTAEELEEMEGNTPEMVDPAWWLGNGDDDWYEHVYTNLSFTKRLHSLRTLKVKNFFNPVCGNYRFNITAMPTVSVIVTVQNEQPQLLSITIHTLLGRTPPELLKEIIIVDDNGIPAHIRQDQNETEFEEIKTLSPKIKIIQNYDREGCARSRTIGAKAATGEVLMFVDSHVEMLSSTWLQHLLIPIMENPHTMSLQSLDIINDMNDHSYNNPGLLMYGTIDEKFLFTYQGKRFEDVKNYEESPHLRLPYETPFGPGSLFAIRRDEFWRLGGYDKGLYVWGGENTELALKIWTCGGRMVMVPCSRTGHMYRVHIKETGRWPPLIPQKLTDGIGLGMKGKWLVHGARADNFTKIVTRNNMRVMNIWMRNHPAKSAFYQQIFGTPIPPPEWLQFETQLETDAAAQEQIRIRDKNQCKDFEWFDKHVFYKLLGKHHPWHPSHPRKVSCGAHMADSCEECPQGHGREWCNGHCKWCFKGEGKCLNETEYVICNAAYVKEKEKVKVKDSEKRKE